MEAGLDSLGATELSARLSSLTGAALPSTLAFDQPTPRTVAAHVLEAVNRAQRPCCTAHAAAELVQRPCTLTPSLGLQGLSGRLAGGVDTADGLGTLLHAAGNAVSHVPTARWATQAEDAAVGAFLCGIELFDASIFGLSRAEVDEMDPQQRLLLDVSYEALHGASCRRRSLMGRRYLSFTPRTARWPTMCG